jgi:hypothetical protein
MLFLIIAIPYSRIRSGGNTFHRPRPSPGGRLTQTVIPFNNRVLLSPMRAHQRVALGDQVWNAILTAHNQAVQPKRPTRGLHTGEVEVEDRWPVLVVYDDPA